MIYIPIVLAFTSNYVVPAGTTLQSILNHLGSNYRLKVICLLSEDLSEEHKAFLETIDTLRVEFRFLNLKGLLGSMYIDPRYSEAATYRLMLPNILGDIDKIIYLDCDIIVRNNVGDLYDNINLGENYLAAVYEAPLIGQVEYIKSIGCEPGKYFNSGFLVMNLKQMRLDNLSEKLLLLADNEKLQFPDQDALNQACQGKVIALDPIYNSIRTYFLPQYKKEFLSVYLDNQWNAVQMLGNIHYTGEKPWNSHTVQFDEWWKCFRLLSDAKWNFISVRPKILLLSRLYASKVGKWSIKAGLNLYRKIKYSV